MLSEQGYNEIVAQIAKGNLIAAIKSLREATGFGLKESKDLAEAIRDQRLSYEQVMRSSGLALSPAKASGDISDLGAMARAGRKIEAIKIYRERMGVGLKEAKDAVEALERGGTL